jgi:hypothetical protein
VLSEKRSASIASDAPPNVGISYIGSYKILRRSRVLNQAQDQQVSLCEALDRILNKGAVVVADVTISVANIDLIYLSLQAVLTSVTTGQ